MRATPVVLGPAFLLGLLSACSADHSKAPAEVMATPPPLKVEVQPPPAAQPSSAVVTEATPSAEPGTRLPSQLSTGGAAIASSASTRSDASGELQKSVRMAPKALNAPAPMMMVAPAAMAPPATEDRETYGHYEANPVQRVAENPVSTFSIDVDTGSYSNVRRFLNQGRLPPTDAVRVEELINYFDYAYASPEDRSTPFAVHTEVAPTPWNTKTLLLRVGIQGWKPAADKIPPSNLVFLVDVSGSMFEPDKLPLVKSALKLLARQMSARDRISLVVYAGNSGVVLEPTAGDQTAKIEEALDRLEAGGSTNGAAGIREAYQLARQSFIKGGNNRVLLATDGDFNVGTTDFNQLLDLIREERKSGIALTTLGVGGGNYNDRNMEQLADAGDGNYAYLDSLQEAEKVLVEQRAGTLMTIARDVKIQVEFNPTRVAEYRLIGYEDRLLKREDFSNDKVDAGDIGAGHRVTALYEIALAGSGGERIEALRYSTQKPESEKRDELAFLRLRYKRPEDGMDARSRLIETPVPAAEVETAGQASPSFRLAAAVAAYGQLLRGGTYTGTFGYADVQKLAADAGAQSGSAEAGEFMRLAHLADALGTKAANAAGAKIAEE